MSHHIVEVKELTYKYPDGTPALNGVSFRITHGESVALVGANGAGKSTLLLHLNGFLTPQTGSVRIGDMPLTKKTLKHVRQTVGMVFQDPDDQLFLPRVYDDVAFGPTNLGLPPDEVKERVMSALALVGGTHLKDRPPYRLSAGEKRAVSIATVLAMSPSILVMDEPTSNLDPKARRQLMHLLSKFEHTKIIATHDMDMVLDLCSRAIVLRKGEIAADGTVRDILNNQDLLDASGLEKPLCLQGCPICGILPAGQA
ncbi:MAG: ABC transporter ATP-binding protein [Syntrophobacteraceae bacterium]|jgi:cobalt/nickel transport system ATP-binding protein